MILDLERCNKLMMILLELCLQLVCKIKIVQELNNFIGTKWMFRNEQNEDGVVVKNKARLVAQGWLPLRDSRFILVQVMYHASTSVVFDHVF